jgi:hypothetical protein
MKLLRTNQQNVFTQRNVKKGEKNKWKRFVKALPFVDNKWRSSKMIN